jgi:cytochrome bd-type quinol oxidase subunit 1
MKSGEIVGRRNYDNGSWWGGLWMMSSGTWAGDLNELLVNRVERSWVASALIESSSDRIIATLLFMFPVANLVEFVCLRHVRDLPPARQLTASYSENRLNLILFAVGVFVQMFAVNICQSPKKNLWIVEEVTRRNVQHSHQRSTSLWTRNWIFFGSFLVLLSFAMTRSKFKISLNICSDETSQRDSSRCHGNFFWSRHIIASRRKWQNWRKFE